MTRAQREEIERRLQASSAAATRLVERSAPEQLRARPRADSWSAAECLAHLNLTAAAFVPRLETALGGLRDEGPRGVKPSRMEWIGRLLNWSLEPRPWSFRLKAVSRASGA